MTAELERAVNAVKLLTQIRQEDPELWEKIQEFARKGILDAISDNNRRTERAELQV